MKVSTFLISSLIFVAAQTTWALPESQVTGVIKQRFNESKRCFGEPDDCFWTLHTINTPRGTIPKINPTPGPYRLRYSRFGNQLGSLGAMVIAPGRGEASIDFMETAIDYINLGYSPVYVIDHRGQGFSPRLLPPTTKSPENRHKAHLGAYRDYINDFAHFVAEVEDELENKFGRTDEPLFFTSNSMGGAVGVGYFQLMGEDNPFAAASLIGSQVIVNYLSFFKKGLVADGKFNSEAIIRGYVKSGGSRQGNHINFIADFRCSIGDCEGFGKKPGVYTRKVFKPNSEEIMTHSRNRFELKNYFRNDVNWNGLIARQYQPAGIGREYWWDPSVGGATVQWTRETSWFNWDMVKKKNLKKMTNIPLRLITGEYDLRAYREYTALTTAFRRANGLPDVDLYHHNKMCDDLNEVYRKKLAKQGIPASNICDHIILPDGFHEVYSEADKWRDQAILGTHQHFCRFVNAGKPGCR